MHQSQNEVLEEVCMCKYIRVTVASYSYQCSAQTGWQRSDLTTSQLFYHHLYYQHKERVILAKTRINL